MKPVVQSPVARRAVAFGLLVALLVFVYLVMLAPYLSLYNDHRQTVAELTHRLQHYHGIAAQRDSINEELQSLAQKIQNGRYYLEKDAPALASAELQQRVKEIISAHHGQVVSMQVATEPTEGATGRVTLKTRMRGSIEDLQKILFEMESQRPLLFLDNAFIRSNPASNPRRAGVAHSRLDIGFDVSAYLRVPLQ